MSEQREALMRIPVAIVTGIILSFWLALIKVLALVNLLITLFTGKRNTDLAEFCEIFNTQAYMFMRYITFMSNSRPFPFNKLQKNLFSFSR